MGHKTNLCVKHSLKESRMIEVFFTILQNLYNFITKSTSRFNIYIEKVEESQKGLIMKNLSMTRWNGRAESIKTVRNSFEVLLCVLEELCMNGNDRDCRKTTASDLLEEVKDLNFYISLVFMRNMLYKMKIVTLNFQEMEIDAIQAFDTMTLTYKECKRIQNDNEEVTRLIKLSADNAAKNDVNPYSECEKKNRMKVGKAVTEEEENCEKIIKDLFTTHTTHYKCELNKVSDRLISDITYICTYMKEVIMSVTILHPKNICSCTKADVEILCSKFPTNLNDSDGLFCDIELVRESITESDTETIQEAAKFLTGKLYKYSNLLKAYQIALNIPVSVAGSERSFSKLKIVRIYL